MTPSRSAPSWQNALGHALAPSERVPAGVSPTWGLGSAWSGTLLGELLELLKEVGRRDASPPPVSSDLNADGVGRRHLGQRQCPSLGDGLRHLRLLRPRQLDV